MDLENQKRVKEFAEEYGPENVVVIVGAAEGEAAGLAAETVTAGDPTFAGPLTGVQLGLTTYHVCEPELKKEFDYEEYGGAPILGVDGPVLKIHGSSTANAVRNAIIKSVPYSKENVVEIIRQSMLELEEVIEKDEEEYSINE